MELFVLAFDHRTSLMRSSFGVEGEPTDDDVARARWVKRVIWEGLLVAIGDGRVPRANAAALVDATYGVEVIAAARREGVRVAVPVEASGRSELAFEEVEWRDRLDAFAPAWAKVLIRYNPEGDAAMNARQRIALGALVDHCEATDRGLMLELLVPPEPHHDAETYDRKIRPSLVARAIEEIRDDGIAADVWKIEGLERREDCERVAAAAGAPCVVLGRGADREAVDRWLRAGAGVQGFVGFAIGRSIWWDAVRRLVDGEIDEATAAAQVADEYARYVDVFRTGTG
jgi:myo-inositol catabolism protein IolC